MRKIVHFETERKTYAADAVVITCFDARFRNVCRKLLKRLGVAHADLISIAGAAKALASPADECEREFVLAQLRASVRLHQSRRVLLLMHSDCGAYGGLQAFADDPASEALHHSNELCHAADLVRSVIPEVTVETYFLDFEGGWRVETSEVAPAA